MSEAFFFVFGVLCGAGGVFAFFLMVEDAFRGGPFK